MDLSTLILCSVVFALVLLLLSLARRLSRLSFSLIPVQAKTRGHHWVYVEAFPAGKYCAVCETSTFHGGECDHCGVVVDDSCLRKADAAIACKSLAAKADSKSAHHWLHGNLPPGSLCSVCEELAGDGPGLQVSLTFQMFISSHDPE